MLKKERIKLTDARALLLFVLYDLIKQGEFVSEFSSEKICYFLQRFGAKKYFKLEFESNFYGPYSGKVRFVLNALNGSYIIGYNDMNKKPFDPLILIYDGYETVKKYVDENQELSEIYNKTRNFLDGFYSDYTLELLSTIDFISIQNNTLDKKILINKLNDWSDRKKSLFSDPKHLDISINHLLKTTFN